MAIGPLAVAADRLRGIRGELSRLVPWGVRSWMLVLLVGCEPAADPPPPSPSPSPPAAVRTVPADAATVTVDARRQLVVVDSDECGLVVDHLYIAANATTLEPAQLSVLADHARMFRCFYDTQQIRRLEVGGHADVRERDPRQLSRERARAVRRMLIERGVPEVMLTTEAYGATQPFDRAGTARAQAKNRRVSFLVLSRGSR